MGHAAHFLRRLDRVSDGHVELALTLYRDHVLLREVLSRASLPDGAERLAISLDDPVEGPFVVVTREGRFVTCLGAGMLVSNLPIVTRERLDAAAAKVERMREQLGRVRALRESGADGQAALAFKRMQQQGARFAREDAETLLRVEPLIEYQVAREVAELNVALLETATKLGTLRLDAPHRFTSRQRELVLGFGDAAWGLAHMTVLFGASALRSSFVHADRELGHEESTLEQGAQQIYQWGTFMHAFRGLWLLAKGGKPALATVKARDVAEDLPKRIYRELALTTIALGSDKLRAEAQKALWPRGALAQPDEAHPWEAMSAGLAEHAHRVIDGPEAADETFLSAARLWAARVLSAPREPTQEEVDAVPPEVARAAYASAHYSIHHPQLPGRVLAVNVCALPWVARAEPAELFLPAAWAQRILAGRSVEQVLSWFVPFAMALGFWFPRVPRRVEAAPGRNAPCPCGSGKKHKRCCGSR